MNRSPDRVRVWSSQLVTNDFPPVCAMTGRPAQMWRPFRAGPPADWVVKGLMGIGGSRLIRHRISGHLPLTKSSNDMLALIETSYALFPLALLAWVGGFWLVRNYSADADLSALGGTLILIAVGCVFGFVCGVVVRSLVGPTAKVVDLIPGALHQVVELRRVHPSFVAAVSAQHARWVAQSPGSN